MKVDIVTILMLARANAHLLICSFALVRSLVVRVELLQMLVWLEGMPTTQKTEGERMSKPTLVNAVWLGRMSPVWKEAIHELCPNRALGKRVPQTQIYDSKGKLRDFYSDKKQNTKFMKMLCESRSLASELLPHRTRKQWPRNFFCCSYGPVAMRAWEERAREGGMPELECSSVICKGLCSMEPSKYYIHAGSGSGRELRGYIIGKEVG